MTMAALPSLTAALRWVAPAAALMLSGCAFMRGKPIEHDPVTYESGLVVQDLFLSSGVDVKPGDEIWIHYTGWLDEVDGERFDSSLDRGAPFYLLLGETQVPAGLEEGLVGMYVCGRRRMWLPPELGFGEEGVEGVVPPNAKLVFDVELLSIGVPPTPEDPEDPAVESTADPEEPEHPGEPAAEPAAPPEV